MKKHGRLFTHLPFEADVGFDNKLGARCFEPFSHGLPLCHGQYSTKVAHRDTMAIDGAGLAAAARVWCQMRHDLMPVKIEINPFRRTAALGAT